MTTYKKAVHEVIGAKECDIDIAITRQSVWETAISPIHLPSNVDLVGYWPFNEGSGMVAYDKSKNGNDGTLVNMEEEDWVDGVVGKALEFDGDNYVDVGNDASLDIMGNEVTVAFWIWLDANFPAEAWDGLVIQSGGRKWGFKGGSSNSRVYFYINGTALGASGFSLSAWHLVVGTYDNNLGSNQKKVYIDGELDVQATQSGTIESIGATNIHIGREGTYYFDGKIDEVRIYNRALTEGEIKALYLYPSGPTTWSDNKIIQKDE